MAGREALIEKAEKLVVRGRLEAAIRKYRKVLEESSEDTGTLNRVGDLYARLHKVDEAVELFLLTADHYVNEGFFVKAIAIYKKIIRLDPTQLEVYERLAELYHRQGLVTEARTQYQVVADYYAKHGKLDAAIEIHRKMSGLEPHDPVHHVSLAELYQTRGLLDRAVGEYVEIADLMLAHGKGREATRVYLKALDVGASDVSFVAEAMLKLRQGGHLLESAALYQAATERFPEAMARIEVEAEEASASDEDLGHDLATEDVDLSDAMAEVRDLGFEQLRAPRVARREPPAAKPPTPKPEEVRAETPRDDDDVFVLDLDEDLDAAELLKSAGEPGPPERSRSLDETEIVDLEIDLDRFERQMALEELDGEDPTATAGSGPLADMERSEGVVPVDELLSDADVFVKYGLEVKAIESLEQAIAVAPERPEPWAQLIRLVLDRQDQDRIPELVRGLANACGTSAAQDLWEEIQTLLESQGFVLEAEAARDSTDPTAESSGMEAPPVGGFSAMDLMPEELLAQQDEESAAPGGAGDAAASGFFNLAAEIEEELKAEVGPLEDQIPTVEEESLEEIVAGFKKGVAEVISPEAYESHFNLGIAYREMGLLDEAIGEFQIAAKDPSYLLECCSNLGGCFYEKGFPDLALKWYQRGLQTPGISEEGTLGLMYDIGCLHMATGDNATARDLFVEIYGINSNYRDVVAKLEELCV